LEAGEKGLAPGEKDDQSLLHNQDHYSTFKEKESKHNNRSCDCTIS